MDLAHHFLDLIGVVLWVFCVFVLSLLGVGGW